MDYQDPATIGTMAELRAQIDRIDDALVALLRRRQDHVDRAIELKPAEGITARAPSRVEDVLQKTRARAEAAGLDPGLAERIWTDMIETFIAREEQVIGKGAD